MGAAVSDHSLSAITSSLELGSLFRGNVISLELHPIDALSSARFADDLPDALSDTLVSHPLILATHVVEISADAPHDRIDNLVRHIRSCQIQTIVSTQQIPCVLGDEIERDCRKHDAIRHTTIPPKRSEKKLVLPNPFQERRSKRLPEYKKMSTRTLNC